MARNPRHPAYVNPQGSTDSEIRLPSHGTPRVEPVPPVREPPSRITTLRMPGVDDRLARPEEGEEYVDGEVFGWESMAGDPEHADPQCQLAYVVRACVAPGYIASTELLTRTDRKSDFATDVCVRQTGKVPGTNERYLEEISFEVANSQTLTKLEKRAKKLVQRGVRRVFGIMVKQGEILEWTPAGRFKARPLAGEIRDRVFKKPLRIGAILDAVEADRLVVEALWEKREPSLVKLVEEEKAKGHIEGHIEGRIEGLMEGRTEGLVEGRSEGLVEGILLAFQVHGITLDAESQQALLDCQNAALLKRWLEKALVAGSAADIVAELEKMS